MDLTNREIAIAAWAAIGAFLLVRRSVRLPVLGLLKTLLQSQVIVAVALAAGYVGTVLVGLNAVGLWSPALTKDTALWFLFAGLALMFRHVEVSDGATLLREVVKDNIKVVVAVEYVTASYTLPFVAEFLLLPVLLALAAMDAVAAGDERLTTGRKLILGLQVMAGSIILMFAVRGAIADAGNLFTLTTVRSILLPVILSLLFAPFVYAVSLLDAYQRLFMRMRVGIGDNSKAALRRKLKWALFRHIGLSIRKLRRFVAQHSLELWELNDEGSLRTLLMSASGDSQRRNA